MFEEEDVMILRHVQVGQIKLSVSKLFIALFFIVMSW